MFDDWQPVYEVEGRVVADPERLYRTRKGWVEPAPISCPAGHRLGPKKALVGSLACLAVAGFHRLHTCVQCGYTIYTPPLTPNCKH
ncbi:hypothetical protein [Nocardia vinacea]|uniref:hypothetical protein n=1 Tax=Nocardia vinacea TaxID=96468 RepID=UPI000592BF36|nr:hypothetical protein [Nocardia vinacea]